MSQDRARVSVGEEAAQRLPQELTDGIAEVEIMISKNELHLRLQVCISLRKAIMAVGATAGGTWIVRDLLLR